jgi:hypothetical protein
MRKGRRVSARRRSLTFASNERNTEGGHSSDLLAIDASVLTRTILFRQSAHDARDGDPKRAAPE